MQQWVESVEILTGNDPVGTLTLVPDVSASLIYGALKGDDAVLMAVGAHSRAQYHVDKPLRFGVRVRIRPGHARAVLGVPAAELTDRFVPAAELWGAADAGRYADDLAALTARLTAAASGPAEQSVRSPAAGVALFPGRSAVASAGSGTAPESGDRLCRPLTGRHDMLAAAVSDLAAGAPTGVAAARLGISERRLRTVFAREIGLSPKHAARILRLRRVLERAPGRGGWAAVADETGFFDQAHLIGDFRSLMGVSPGAYLAGRVPHSGPCVRRY
ncbi:helix-turn-helix domain-containing protein [Catenuloplanes sp. NPDC051500]|uniref:AraC family transcriptional regulator n=1 Tax=Catenuloplanes sp. NPDC051500 TaxID=3363959 RepID=UPI0037B0557C